MFWLLPLLLCDKNPSKPKNKQDAMIEITHSLCVIGVSKVLFDLMVSA